MTNVAPIGSPLDTVGPAAPAPAAPVTPPASPTADAAKPIAPAADFRLVIEEDAHSRGFVYKTIDRSTGEVIHQYPREELLSLKDAENYVPGKVFNSQS